MVTYDAVRALPGSTTKTKKYQTRDRPAPDSGANEKIVAKTRFYPEIGAVREERPPNRNGSIQT